MLVLVGAALAVKLAGPVVAAVAELVHVLVIVAAILLGVAGAGLVAFITWRWHRYRHPGAARAVAPRPSAARAVQPPPEPRAALERVPEFHLHLHGVAAEGIAAILRKRQLPGHSHESRE